MSTVSGRPRDLYFSGMLSLLAFFAGPCLASGQAPPELSEWEGLEMQPPAGTVYGPSEQIRLAGVPNGRDVSVDLDADPWPGRIEAGDGVRTLTPEAPLARGEHRLRVFEKLSDGRIEERGRWHFEVGGDKVVRREGSQALDATLDAGWRAGGEGVDPDVGRFQGTASARWQGWLAADRWRLDADTALVYDSRAGDLVPDAAAGFEAYRDFDLTTFRVVGEAGPATFTLGDQQVSGRGGESLVLGWFYRRGLSARLAAGGGQLTAFAVATQPVVGTDAGLGVDDAANRVDGVVLDQVLSDSEAARVTASAVYLTGEGSPEAGVGLPFTAPETLPSAGDAWGLALSGALFGERLRLAGEYAESRFDLDGAGQGAGARDAEAFSLSATLSSPGGGWGAERPFDWEVGVTRERIGTFFRSLANPSLLSDRDTLEGSTRLEWPQFDLRFDLRRREDNVDDLPDRPRARADAASFSLLWHRDGGLRAGEDGGESWWRPQSVSVSGYQSDEESLSDSELFDRLSRTLQLTVNGEAWSLSYAHDRFEDDFLPSGALTHQLAGLSATFSGERWSLRPLLQWTRLGGSETDEVTTLARLSSVATLVPDRLTGTLAVDVLRLSAGELDRSLPSVSGELTWQVSRPGRLPLLALWLRGNYSDDEPAELVTSASASQVFLGARLSWRRTF